MAGFAGALFKIIAGIAPEMHNVHSLVNYRTRLLSLEGTGSSDKGQGKGYALK